MISKRLYTHGTVAANMDALPCEGAESVKVGVLLTAEDTDCVVIREGGHGLDYKPGNNEEAKSFSFDQVVMAGSIQILHPELLQPLIESVSSGYNGALLLCGASTEEMSALIDDCIIKQVLEDVFHPLMSQVKEEWFISVSFLQFYPDGSVVDVLSPNGQTLKHVTHPVLGSLIEGSCEVCVCSAEEAFALYKTCRKTLKANAGAIYSRCSSLFSVAVESKLHPEEEESEVCRSRLQLFSLAGAASRADLRGVNPLVKIVDQTQCEATTDDTILHSLLNNSLTGNSKTVVVYCIHPAGLLDDETPSALAISQKVRSLETKATAARWYLRATTQEIRAKITALRTEMMSRGENDVEDLYRLAELTQNLRIVKNQSWEKRREKSMKIKEKTQILHLDGTRHSRHHRENTDEIKRLKDQLKGEMEEHIGERKGDAGKVRERVRRIQQLREALGEEMLKKGGAAEQPELCQHSQLEYNEGLERRRKFREDSARLIQVAVEKMERELAQKKTEGPQRELLVLSRERQVLVMQIEALRAEAEQAERDLQNQHHRHRTELQCLRDESLQVFREFHHIIEEQRKMSEDRYRSVLLEAVQDAVYLSAQRKQLQAENKLLHKALAEMKDTIVVQGDPNGKISSQQ